MSELTAEEYEQLEDYAMLDGTEIGEYLGRLIDVRQFNTCHGMTDEFDVAVTKELRFWLNRFQNETEIEVTTHEVTKTIEERELVWYDC